MQDILNLISGLHKQLDQAAAIPNASQQFQNQFPHMANMPGVQSAMQQMQNQPQQFNPAIYPPELRGKTMQLIQAMEKISNIFAQMPEDQFKEFQGMADKFMETPTRKGFNGINDQQQTH